MVLTRLGEGLRVSGHAVINPSTHTCTQKSTFQLFLQIFLWKMEQIWAGIPGIYLISLSRIELTSHTPDFLKLCWMIGLSRRGQFWNDIVTVKIRSFIFFFFLGVLQISRGLWLAGELHWPVWPGRIHSSTQLQPQPPFPEDLGTFSLSPFTKTETRTLALMYWTPIHIRPEMSLWWCRYCPDVTANTRQYMGSKCWSKVDVCLCFRCCSGC